MRKQRASEPLAAYSAVIHSLEASQPVEDLSAGFRQYCRARTIWSVPIVQSLHPEDLLIPSTRPLYVANVHYQMIDSVDVHRCLSSVIQLVGRPSVPRRHINDRYRPEAEDLSRR